MSEVLAKAQHFGDTLDSIVRPPSLEIGRLLCPADAKPNAQNPNVEVLCMALQTTPLTKDKFIMRKGDKKAVKCSWLVVRVGPPGFSSAPYKPGKKTEGTTERLYVANRI